jgi:microsomal epoxide hydrolase
MERFIIDVSDERLARIRARVRDYEWHEAPEDGGWAFGADLDYMKALCAYWLDGYDWRAQETALNVLPNFVAEVDGIKLHFVREKGSGSAPRPLILIHGWPGSFYEFAHVVEPLAHPERFGGDVADAFDVIVPSLPGYAFSGKPRRPIGPRAVARLMAGLMTDTLGYRRYIAQGGDWGSSIAGWLGFEHAPACAAIHMNMYGLRGSEVAPETEAERDWARRHAAIFGFENGYFRVQSTKPQSLSYAMMDSPVGVAAWLVEKFNAWSDTRGDDVESRYSKDQLLTNIMLYLVTRSFNTASWLYRGLMDEIAGDSRFPRGSQIDVPVGVANFPKDFVGFPPRSQVARTYNIVHWTDMPRGGHFAAMEEPALFVDDVRAFARKVPVF